MARVRSTFLAGGLLAPLLLTVLTVVAPSIAEARCTGPGTETISTMSYNGLLRVEENPVNGTCDGDNVYRSQIRSRVGLWTAVPYIQNGGIWSPKGSASELNVWTPYQYTDTNSYSYIMLCAHNPGKTNWICGWGSNSLVLATPAGTQPTQSQLQYVNAYGVNSNF